MMSSDLCRWVEQSVLFSMLFVQVRAQTGGQVIFQVPESSDHRLILTISSVAQLLWWPHHLQHITTVCMLSQEYRLAALNPLQQNMQHFLSSWMFILEHLHIRKENSTANTCSRHVFGSDLCSHYSMHAYWTESPSEKLSCTSHYRA